MLNGTEIAFMIQNLDEPKTQERLSRAREGIPGIAPLLDALERHQDPFEVLNGGEGIEVAALKPVNNRPNRARMKLFVVGDGPMRNRAAAFFYKRSQVPYSRDRLSYGVCMVPTTGPSSNDIEDWLFFASSGFDPAARPGSLRQAFAFTVPD